MDLTSINSADIPQVPATAANCFTCLGPSRESLPIVSEDCDDDSFAVLELMLMHFWFQRDDFRADQVVCRSCWTQLKVFHRFYLEVKRNHELLAASSVEPADVIKQEQNDQNEVETSSQTPITAEPQVCHQDDDLKSECPSEGGGDDITPIRTESESESEVSSVELIKKKRKGVKRKATGKPAIKRERKTITYKVKTAKQLAEEDEIIKTHVQYTCELCAVISPTFTGFQRHVKNSHPGNKAFIVCCERRYYRKNNLLEHVQQLGRKDMFKCDVCFKSFINTHGVRRHKQLMHLPDHIKIYRCERCPKRFAKQTHLAVHLKHHENLDNEIAKCSECGRTFPSEAVLKQHVKIRHTRPTDFICDVCAKGFYSEAEFLRHKIEHENPADLRVQCDICQLWFRSRIHLNDHKRRHRQPPVTCDLCGHVSPNKKAMASHRRLRHGQSSLICQECGKAFKRPITLREHMASHTGAALYTCNFCERTFNSSANMFSHRKKMHPQEWLKLRSAQLAERHGVSGTSERS
ncbi:transcription factor grauzone-like [Sabethes cyaneus]|uniref:transcription factor grauzone-like n=1 Tax=Sabethes cyaneus TaxID=53552 RepID=UPI00237DFED2|nr:transcription factor grauzone-like [Sabethes cyaneus]